MARIPDSEIERLKNEVSVQRLIEASGIELKKAGKDLTGCCPFHEDDTASLVVTPAKNLWHCFGCGIGGGPIDWVMKRNGVSFRHAVELLRDGIPSLAAGSGAVKHSTVRALPAPVMMDADDQALLNQVAGYYHETLKQSPEALAYLKTRGIDAVEVIEHFKLGYANRTLGLRLPQKNRVAGSEIRTRLQKIGIYRESGHEHFNGSLIVPVLDESGNVMEVYGRKLLDNLRAGTPKHLYLPAREGGRGVFNVQALAASKEIILCEALIDALTFWCAGYRNVTSSYGIEGFTEDMLEAFKRYGTQPNGKPLSFTSQQLMLVPLKAFFKWAARERHILSNPASELILPKKPASLPRYVLTIAQVESVLNETDVSHPGGVRDRAMLEVLYSTGLRRTELASLIVPDWNRGGTLTVRQGKGGRDRVVPVGARAEAWLTRYVDDVRPELVTSQSGDTLFLTDYGEAFNKNRLGDLVRRYLDWAGITVPGSCHLFRHACATHMLENGADVRYIQVLLGHADINSTEIYTRVSITKLREIHAATHPARLERVRGDKNKADGPSLDEAGRNAAEALLDAIGRENEGEA